MLPVLRQAAGGAIVNIFLILAERCLITRSSISTSSCKTAPFFTRAGAHRDHSRSSTFSLSCNRAITCATVSFFLHIVCVMECTQHRQHALVRHKERHSKSKWTLLIFPDVINLAQALIRNCVHHSVSELDTSSSLPDRGSPSCLGW